MNPPLFFLKSSHTLPHTMQFLSLKHHYLFSWIVFITSYRLKMAGGVFTERFYQSLREITRGIRKRSCPSYFRASQRSNVRRTRSLHHSHSGSGFEGRVADSWGRVSAILDCLTQRPWERGCQNFLSVAFRTTLKKAEGVINVLLWYRKIALWRWMHPRRTRGR